MKTSWVILYFLFASYIFSQTTTYSEYEEQMVWYLSNSISYTKKYDSLQIAQKSLDSCYKFLKKYPNSFAKPNVFSFMLEMTVLLTDDLNRINPLIDSTLYYDKIASTQLRVGELLIERNLDVKKGRNYVVEAFPKLTVLHHKYRAYMLMAESDIALGKKESARSNYEKAMELEPDRLWGWYEYLGYTKYNELPQMTKIIETKIKTLEKQSSQEYLMQTEKGVNINKNISNIKIFDIDSTEVKFQSYIGKVVILNKFNFWCSYCAKEFPILKNIMKEFPEVVFLFVNFGETSKELKNVYFTNQEFDFLKNQTVLIGNKQFNDIIYGHGVPHTLVVDKKGNIRFDYLGLDKNLDKLLRNNLSKLLNE